MSARQTQACGGGGNRERIEEREERKEKEESEWRRLFRFYVLCTYISRSTLQLTCVLEDRIYCLRTLAFVDSSVTRSCNRGKESHKSLTEKTLSNSRGQGVCCPFSAAFFHFSPTHSLCSLDALHASICRWVKHLPLNSLFPCQPEPSPLFFSFFCL